MVGSTRSRAGGQHSYIDLTCKSTLAACRHELPGWAAVRVKHFLVLLVVSVFAPRFLQPTGALDQRQPGSLTALNSL